MSEALPLVFHESRIQEIKSAIENPQEIWLLHGYGSHQDDLFGFAPYLSKDYRIRSLRPPHPIGGGGFAWYELSFDFQGIRKTNEEEAQASIMRIAEGLAWHQREYPLAPRPVLFGFSQGGILANAMASLHPGLMRAVISIASYYPLEWTFLSHNRPAIPQFAAVGTEDGVVQSTLSLPSYDRAQREFGRELTVKSYPMPHTISTSCFRDVMAWLKDL